MVCNDRDKTRDKENHVAKVFFKQCDLTETQTKYIL